MWLRWFAIALIAAIAFIVVDGWRAFGHRATGARRERMEHSPQWKDGHFENPQPLWNDAWGALAGAFHASAHTSPLDRIDATLAAPPRSCK